MSLMQSILIHKPSTWDYRDGIVIVPRNSSEFATIQRLIIEGGICHEIHEVKRIQNVALYGQFICREQFHSTSSDSQYYIVKKFIKLDEYELNNALKYNLDPRRLSSRIRFLSHIDTVYGDEVILIVSVLTENPQLTFHPSKNSDFYIEYVVTFS